MSVRSDYLAGFLQQSPELDPLLLHQTFDVFLKEPLPVRGIEQLSQLPPVVLPQLLACALPGRVSTANLMHQRRRVCLMMCELSCSVNPLLSLPSPIAHLP